ncbi:unnamed protein product [Rhodiola kirilowii]
MFPINFPANDTVPVDPEIWDIVCAGRDFKLPEVDTDVYYFPEGHAEQWDDFPQAVASFFRPMVPCRVLNVRYLADRVIDDLFAAIFLRPTGSHFRGATPAASSQVGFGGDLTPSIGAQREGSHIAWDTKVLTQSDVGNGNRFSVPKRCAMSIFPPLKLEEDPPVQILTISDVQAAGMNREFRHIYQGGQHWLTTGWTTFCEYKRLVAGDTVVLMKDKLTGKLYIGIRRLPRGGAESNRRRPLHLEAGGGTGDSQRFVAEAARYAAQGMPFEVFLYPKNGFRDFVVKADLVDMALSLRWAVGMRVKKNVAAGDCSMPQWISGRVSMVMIPQEGGQWRGSPWKMLQITWDQPQLPQNVERLSPWQVEYLDDGASPLPIHPLIFPGDHRFSQPLARRNREPHSPMPQGEPWSAPHTHLASMQGARHSSDVSDLTIGGDTAYQMQSDETSDMSLLMSRIAEVNPGSHQFVNLSTESHSSLRSYGPEVGNSLPHDGNKTVKLFGKIINVQNPVEKQPDDAAHCLETDSSKGDKEAS